MKKQLYLCESCTNKACFIKKNIHVPNMKKYLNVKYNIICKKSKQFIVEGAPLQGLYFIYKGKAKVVRTGINGREQIVRFVTNGSIVGFRGFGIHNRYLIGAYALEDMVLCNFSNEVMIEMLNNIPQLTYDLMFFYAEELYKSENNVRKLAQMNVRERVIDSLLYIHRKFGQSKDFIDVNLTRKDIADYAGTTEEQVTRIVSALKKEKLILTEGKKIGILKAEVMKKEISEHKYIQ